MLRLIVKEKAIRLNLRWVKGHSVNFGNNIAYEVANATATTLRNNMIAPAEMTKHARNYLDITPLYDSGQAVNIDLMEKIKDCAIW
jgi:hypothetical protein